MISTKFRKYFYIAITIYIVASIYSTGSLYPDEYGQILLFAIQKLHLINIQRLASENRVPWEYYAQIRPSLLPWFAIIIYKLYQFIMPRANPYNIVILMRFAAASLTLFSSYLFIKVFLVEIKTPVKQQWFVLLSLFSYVICLTGVHFTSETLSSRLFLIAFCLYFLPNINKSFLKYLLIGGIMGLSFFSRFQIGFMIAGFSLWLICIDKIKIRYLILIIVGFILATFINLGLDYYYYGNFVVTPWQYFVSNIIQHKAANYGVEPWYDYVIMESSFLPYGPLYVIATIYFCFKRPRHVITWTIVPFILVHMLIAHKEPRFLIPVLPFIGFILVDTIEIIQKKYQFNLTKLAKSHSIIWYINLIFLVAVSFYPQTLDLYVNHFVSDNYKGPTMIYYLSKDTILDFYQPTYIKRDKVDDINKLSCVPNEVCLLNTSCKESIQYSSELSKYTQVYSGCIDYSNPELPLWLNSLITRINRVGGLSVLYQLNKPNQGKI